MSKTMTAKTALANVQTSAEAIRCDQPQHFPEAASPGDVWRQGDLYIELLAHVPAGAVPVDKPLRQLAPGTTQGSRHTLDALDGVSMFRNERGTVLDGPILVLAQPRTVTHPEHGDVVLPPGTYGITYQREYAEELRRVAD